MIYFKDHFKEYLKFKFKLQEMPYIVPSSFKHHKGLTIAASK